MKFIAVSAILAGLAAPLCAQAPPPPPPAKPAARAPQAPPPPHAPPPPEVPKAFRDPYARGQYLLDRRQWEAAIAAFDEVIRRGTQRLDGAYYWKAYALQKLGRNAEGLEQLHELQRRFSDSRWINDLKALELELKHLQGQLVAPETLADEELKLLAINTLMQTDPERAIGLLEQTLAGNQPPRVKDRALFVLMQSGNPKAREIVARVAKGGGSPDLQIKAVEYLALFGGKQSAALLAGIYRSSKDPRVRGAAIDGLAIMGPGSIDELRALYQAESDPKVKQQILRSLAILNSKDAADLASETLK